MHDPALAFVSGKCGVGDRLARRRFQWRVRLYLRDIGSASND